MKLEAALGECTLALLRRIAASHGVASQPETLRAELAGRILQRLREPGYLALFLEALAGEERRLLQAMAESGWLARAFVLDRRFPHRIALARQPSTQEPVPSLLHKGVLFRAFAPIGDWRGEVYYVPEELQPALSEILPPVNQVEKLNLAATATPTRVEQRDAALDLFCLLSFLRRQEPRLFHGSLARTDLSKLEQAWSPAPGSPRSDRWEERWAFLLHLCLAGGWIARHDATLKPTRGAAHLLSGTRSQVEARLLERYLKDRSWSDLAAVGRVREPLGNRRMDETTARRLLVHYLGEWAGSGWVDPAAFCEALRTTNPDFLREDYSSLDWAVVEKATEAEIYGPSSWDPVEGEWIRYVLAGPLAWLGRVQWGRGEEGQAVGFRFLPAEPRAQPPGTTPAAPGVAPRVQVDGDLEVLAPAGADLQLLYRLEPYLELRERQGMGRYRFSKSSVLAGVERGGSWEELRGLLGSSSVDPLPSSAVQRLEEWAAAYGRFTLGWAILLETRTAEDADLLKDDSAIARHLPARLGPTAYRVSPEQLWGLVRQLKEAGHLPRVEPGTRLGAARAGMGDLLVARESLFALLLLRALHGGLEMGDGAQAVRRLESILGPEESKEVARRVQEAARRVR